MTHAIALHPTDLQTFEQMDPLDLALAGFLARYRGKTLIAYQGDLKHYLGWCLTRHLSPLQATRPHLELYLRQMENDGWTDQRGQQHPYSSATISRRFNTVALFYAFAFRDDLIAKDPAAYVDRPKIDKDGQHRPSLTPLQHGIFLAASEQISPTAHALAHLLAVRGMRVGSACNLNVEDIHREQGYDVITFLAKGSKMTTMALPVATMRAVQAAVDGRTSGPVLLNRDGRRLTRAAADRLVQKIVGYAKLDVAITPHSLRRAFVMTQLASGVPARDVQLAAGHANISTTMIYDQRRQTHDRDAAHQLSALLSGIKG